MIFYIVVDIWSAGCILFKMATGNLLVYAQVDGYERELMRLFPELAKLVQQVRLTKVVDITHEQY